jgi:hypothetical protein
LKKGLGDIMGGRVLELETDKIMAEINRHDFLGGLHLYWRVLRNRTGFFLKPFDRVVKSARYNPIGCTPAFIRHSTRAAFRDDAKPIHHRCVSFVSA